MKYVVFKQGGKQYIAKEGDILDLEGIREKEKELFFDEILFYASDGSYKIGTPKVEGVKIKATILGQKNKKIRVAKFKAKARTRRVAGHKIELTRVKVDKISSK